MWEKIKKTFIRGRKKPTMVFSVIGDSVSYVPRLWPVTVFQMALIEAAKSGGKILQFEKKNKINNEIITQTKKQVKNYLHISMQSETFL